MCAYFILSNDEARHVCINTCKVNMAARVKPYENNTSYLMVPFMALMTTLHHMRSAIKSLSKQQSTSNKRSVQLTVRNAISCKAYLWSIWCVQWIGFLWLSPLWQSQSVSLWKFVYFRTDWKSCSKGRLFSLRGWCLFTLQRFKIQMDKVRFDKFNFLCWKHTYKHAWRETLGKNTIKL